MKINYISDLHLGFWPCIEKTIDERVPKCDVLVVAGDLDTDHAQVVVHRKKVFSQLRSKANHVLLVLGNHDFFAGGRSDPQETLALIHQAANDTGVTFLSNSSISIDGVKFYGGTMWYDPFDDRVSLAKLFMPDTVEIGDFDNFASRQHDRFFDNLIKSNADVVISHHLPSILSTPEAYRSSNLNPCFVTSFMGKPWLDNEENWKPKYWIHGHSHAACKYDHPCGTKVYCNPSAYPHEQKGCRYDKDAHFIIE